MKTRAKMQLQEVRQNFWSKDARTYAFSAVCDDGTEENAKFAKYTPTGHFEMVCNNPAVHERLELGKIYYFDISEAES